MGPVDPPLLPAGLLVEGHDVGGLFLVFAVLIAINDDEVPVNDDRNAVTMLRLEVAWGSFPDFVAVEIVGCNNHFRDLEGGHEHELAVGRRSTTRIAVLVVDWFELR